MHLVILNLPYNITVVVTVVSSEGSDGSSLRVVTHSHTPQGGNEAAVKNRNLPPLFLSSPGTSQALVKIQGVFVQMHSGHLSHLVEVVSVSK